MKICVATLGCKVNRVESASIVATLKNHGYDASEGIFPADVYVLNTCSVTSEADRKSRQYITKIRKTNPLGKIIVIGCSSQNNPYRFEKENIIAVGGTANKEAFVLCVLDTLDLKSTPSSKIYYDEHIGEVGKIACYSQETPPISDKTRAFIKIQDGCNRFCTYCIIPYLRGRSRSKSLTDIYNECVQADTKEIVITGIDLSYYGRDIGVTLPDLVRKLACIDVRKRLGSLECEIINDELLTTMGESGFCGHFHLCLQSGSDAVLKSMNRRYTTDFYYEKVELIRKYFPLAGITTDIIVGFPTEDDAEYQISKEFIRKCKFSDIHVFPYSSRPGTIASRKTPLDRAVVESRVADMLEVKKTLHSEFLQKNLNTIASVYVEDSNQNFNEGYTENYIKVYSHADCKSIVNLTLSSIYKDGIIGV